MKCVATPLIMYEMDGASNAKCDMCDDCASFTLKMIGERLGMRNVGLDRHGRPSHSRKGVSKIGMEVYTIH